MYLLSTHIALIAVGAISSSMLVAAQSDYCSISPAHTLCQFPGLSPACGQPLQRGFSETEKSFALDLHNKLRARVAQGEERPQPPAGNMMEMEWDDELAAVAQRWAEQCSFGHDQSRDVQRFRVGQNVYETSRSRDQALSMALREGVMGWYDEVALLNPRSVDSYAFDSGTGHYTQMVWGNTNKVGCGHVTYRSDRWIKKLIVCNYGPAGNFIGSPMYKTGAPCSMCPRGTRCSAQYPGLCTARPAPLPTTSAPAPPVNAVPSPGLPIEGEDDDVFTNEVDVTMNGFRPMNVIPDGDLSNENEIDSNVITDGEPIDFLPVSTTTRRPRRPFAFPLGGRPAAVNSPQPANPRPRPPPRPTRRPFFSMFMDMMSFRPMRFSQIFG